VILRMVGLCLRACICHGVCLVVCYLLNKRLCRLVYVVLCVYVVWGAVRVRIGEFDGV